MKSIYLNNNLIAFVDEIYYDYINQWNWFEHKRQNRLYSYAIRNHQLGDNNIPRLMHRLIWFRNIPDNPDLEIDHIDGNGLNNLKENLRTATRSQNGINRGPNSRNMSGYKGVTWNRARLKWQAQIGLRKEIIKLGVFRDVKGAARAYNRAAYHYFREFAWLNPVDPLF